MAKHKVTKEMVLDEGYRLAMYEGMEQVQVRIIAQNLGCSVQPVYSYFKSMTDLKNEIIERAFHEFLEKIRVSASSDNYILSLCQNLCVQALVYPNLYEYFKQGLLSGVHGFEDLFNQKAHQKVAKQLDLPEFKAAWLMEQMMIYAMGLVTFCSYQDFNEQDRLEHLLHAFESFLKQAKQ
jgi:AcrR family transcriptional regulator